MLTTRRSFFDTGEVPFGIQALRVRGVECVSLPSYDQLPLGHDLIWVSVASRVGDTHSHIVHIEDEVVLAHSGAPDQQLASILNIDGDAIATGLLAVHVLARVPVNGHVFTFRSQEEAKDGERAEVVVGAVGELELAIAEAEVALAREINTPLAVIFGIHRAKVVEMVLDCVVVCRIHVGEGCARIHKSYLLRIA